MAEEIIEVPDIGTPAEVARKRKLLEGLVLKKGEGA